MKRENLTRIAERLKSVFDAEQLNQLGRETGLCQRLRVVTPHRLGLLMVSLFLSRRVETIADIQRGFAALFGEGIGNFSITPGPGSSRLFSAQR